MSGAAVWITGLPASGKSTLASALLAALRADGVVALALDSDDLRPHVVGADGFDDATRERFYGLLAHLAQLGADGGAIVVISATAHRRAWRDAARALVPSFVEVLMDVHASICAARDPKGLWRAAAEHRITTLPGAGVAYEPPLAPEVVVGAELAIDDAVGRVRSVLARTLSSGTRIASPKT